MKINFIFIFFSHILMYIYAGENIYCTGHGLCQAKIIIKHGEYNIFCGAANSDEELVNLFIAYLVPEKIVIFTQLLNLVLFCKC